MKISKETEARQAAGLRTDNIALWGMAHTAEPYHWKSDPKSGETQPQGTLETSLTVQTGGVNTIDNVRLVLH